MRKTLSIAALAAFTMTSLPAAADDSGAFRCEPGETYYMNVMVSGIEYWKPVYEMFEQAANQMGCETEYTGTPEYDVNKQLTSFEQVLARDPAGVFLHPMNPDPFIAPINRAAEDGIPVVTFAADSPNSERVAYVTSDNHREGQAAADIVAEAVGGEGVYAVLENPGQGNHDRRVNAFIEQMKGEWPDMELAGSAATNQDPDKAYQAVKSLAQANPNLSAVFMPEATSAIGAAQAALEVDQDIEVMTVDVNAQVLDLIKGGDMLGAINPNQGMQGYMGFITLFLAAHPEMIDPMNDYQRTGENPFSFPLLDNGFSVVTPENVDDFRWEDYEARREN